MQNVHRADEKRLALQNKCCTFDGNSVDASSTVINKNVEKQIVLLVDKIVEAVKRVVPKGIEIQMMVLHFKASAKGNIFFLYCSSLRLMDEFEVKNAAAGVRNADTCLNLHIPAKDMCKFAHALTLAGNAADWSHGGGAQAESVCSHGRQAEHCPCAGTPTAASKGKGVESEARKRVRPLENEAEQTQHILGLIPDHHGALSLARNERWIREAEQQAGRLQSL
eukprot:2429659-Rhodomonas_salina.6